MDVLLRIKRLVLQDRVRYTVKAKEEMRQCELEEAEVLESIMNARGIDKVLRSRSPNRERAAERLYVIKSVSFQGTAIYTKGKIAKEGDQEVFYVLISAKLDEYEG